jgi:hypothetical protein
LRIFKIVPDEFCVTSALTLPEIPMRRALLTASFAMSLAAPVLAADCTKDVVAAFEKQRTQAAYRVTSKQPSPRGEIETVTSYVLPDKMHSSVVVPGEPAPIETIGISTWAWATHGSGWQELQPQFAQTVSSHIAATLGKPADVTEAFSCKGTVKRGGADYLAFQSEPKATPGKPVGPDNPMLARTVYVDPASGLPALNVVGEPGENATPLMSAAYSYPKDLVIQAPDAVPASKTR